MKVVETDKNAIHYINSEIQGWVKYVDKIFALQAFFFLNKDSSNINKYQKEHFIIF